MFITQRHVRDLGTGFGGEVALTSNLSILVRYLGLQCSGDLCGRVNCVILCCVLSDWFCAYI
jgi:hypothetical protein